MRRPFCVTLTAATLLSAQMARADAGGDAGDAGATVTVIITGLRSTRGVLQACLTTVAEAYPVCEKDPHARRLTVPARNGPALVFRHVAPGTYAIAMIHDENSNGRLDKRLGIPVEGYGFSNNAPIMFGPPRFTTAKLVIGDRDVITGIQVRYIL